MKRRFTLNDDGKLEDRDGNVIGTVVGITLDVDPNFALASPSERSDAGSKSGGSGGGRGSSAVQGSNSGGKDDSDVGEKGMGARSGFDPVIAVWNHYVAVMRPRHAGLDEQTRKVIRDALKVATLSECKRAIDGCASSDFHMGKNDRRKRYNAVSQILKGKPASPRGPGRTTRENIDFFLDLAEKSGLPSGVPSAVNDKVRRAKRAILDATEFPGDEQVVQRGREAEAWLQEQGWRVERSEGSMPRFVEPGAPS